MFHVKQIATIGAIWSIDSSSGRPYLPVSDASTARPVPVHCNRKAASKASWIKVSANARAQGHQH
jgi:hypothetical protein